MDHVKVVIIGTNKIGKSCFGRRINSKLNDKFRIYEKTIVSEFNYKDIKVNNKQYRLEIWDLSGTDESLGEIESIFLKDSPPVILIFYDAMDKKSFEIAKRKYYSIKKENNIIFLVRSKYDLCVKDDNSEIIRDEEALEFVQDNNIYFAHISSIENYETGIDDLLNKIMLEYIQLKLPKLNNSNK